MNTTNEMFCRQCQETRGNTGCVRGGVCGKKSATSALMDELVAKLEEIGAERRPTRELGRFVTKSLFMTLTNANFDDDRLRGAIVEAEKRLGHAWTRKTPRAFAEADLDARSLKELVLFAIKGISAYACHAAELGEEDDDIYAFVFKALREIGESHTMAELAELVLECGKVAVKTMELLDRANVKAFGKPVVSEVKLGVGKKPGILVSGHDLRDLEELLEATRDSGLDVYTHGEMLAAHYYPAFRRFPHLVGNYGGAWHRQQLEFSDFGGAILLTSNCIVPVVDAYRDRIFTTGAAGYPGVVHIADRKNGAPKDFSPVIARAKWGNPPKELEKGSLIGGFAHDQVLSLKDRILAAVKSGAIKRFVVMAGCDGRQATRERYTEKAEKLPKDAIILTAGCAKYRFNKLDLGDIDGIPRVLDAGQCNDAYSLVLIALMLKEALGAKTLGELPLELDIAWYEQKAVAVLLALLALGFVNIKLGPTLPAFLSPRALELFSEKFGLHG